MGLLLAATHIAHYGTTNIPKVSDGETRDHTKPLDDKVTFENTTTLDHDKKSIAKLLDQPPCPIPPSHWTHPFAMSPP